MNYILVNITSFFQEIIKVRLIASTKLWCIFLCAFSCSHTSKKDNQVFKEVVIVNIEVEKTLLELNPLEGKWYYKNKPFNGFAVSYHKDTTLLATSIGYYNGKKEGIAKTWYANGHLKKESFYKQNRLDGIATAWWPDGILQSELRYIDGVLEGVQKRWYPNGQLARQTNLKNGLEVGLQQAWLENGKIYINYEAKNGRTFGLKKASLCYQLKDEVVQY